MAEIIRREDDLDDEFEESLLDADRRMGENEDIGERMPDEELEDIGKKGF